MKTLQSGDPMAVPSVEQKLVARLPIFGAAVVQIKQFYGADLKVTLPAYIGAISTAAGSLLQVETPNQHVSPTSLFIMAISPPATKKTPVMDRVFRTIYKFETQLSQRNDEAVSAYNAEVALWKSRDRSLRRDEKNCPGFPGQMEKIHEAIEAHVKSMPKKFVRKQLLFENLTEAGFAPTLQATKVACIATSEGVNVTESSTLGSIGVFNSVHSGSPAIVNRGLRDPVRLNDVVLTICVMTQPGMIDAIPKAKRQKLLNSGFLQRFLIFDNDVGREHGSASERCFGTDSMDFFDIRLEEILERLMLAVNGGDLTPEVLKFDVAATDLWNVKEDCIGRAMQPGGWYENAADHASKLANNAARLAGLLHFFEGFDGKISRDTLEIAFDICELCSMDYMKTFSKGLEHVVDAELLFAKLEDYRDMGTYPIPKNMARRNAPAPLRERKRFYTALTYLENAHRICVVQGQDGKQYVFFPDNLPPQYIDRSSFGMISLNP